MFVVWECWSMIGTITATTSSLNRVAGCPISAELATDPPASFTRPFGPMKSTLLIFALSCLVCAQSPDRDSKPATSNVPGARYPSIDSDLRVTFSVIAPGAHKVQVQPGGADNGLGKGPF